MAIWRPQPVRPPWQPQPLRRPAALGLPAATIAITAPVANQWGRGGGGALTVTVGGTCTNRTGAIEASTDGGSTWATLDAATSGTTFSGTVGLAASEQDYTISVRHANATSITASVSGIANIRTVIAYGGQSNESGRGTGLQTAEPVFGSGSSRMKTATGYAVLADPTNTEGLTTGSYALHEANVLGAVLGHRVGVVNFAVGGTTLAQWQTFANGGGGNYEALKAAVNAVGGADIVHMGPCETDALNGTTQTAYHAGMVTWAASWAADFPACKILWRSLQHIDTGTASQANQDAINAAITQGAGSTPGKATGDVSGVYFAEVRSVPAFPGDTFHWLSDQQLADVGGIMAGADYAALNPAGGGGAVFNPVGCGFIRGIG